MNNVDFKEDYANSRIMRIPLAILLAAFLAPLSAGQSNESHPELAPLLEKVRERVIQYYVNLQKLAWSDKVRYETEKKDGTPKDKPRELVYDTIVRFQEPRSDDTSMPFYIRDHAELRLLDGKTVRKGQKPAKDDPRFAGMGDLLFLVLRDSRAEAYRYSYAGEGNLDGHKTLIVDIAYPQRTPVQVIWDKSFRGLGVNYNFELRGIQYNKGRIWIDAESHNVRRLEWQSDPFDFEHHGDQFTYQRELTARFRPETFKNPTELFWIPDSLDVVVTIKGGRAPKHRILHSFTGFKRFTGEIRITNGVQVYN
jgi:hypothetical protein